MCIRRAVTASVGGQSGGNAMRAIISMAALCVLIASPAKAIRPDECEQQRAAFPKEWNDVSKEKPVFFCWSHYSGAFKVTLGAGDKDGRRLMSLVPLTGNEKGPAGYLEGCLSHLAGQGAGSSIGRREIFRHHRSAEGIMLDPRSAVGS
jgi:hypothetical protein